MFVLGQPEFYNNIIWYYNLVTNWYPFGYETVWYERVWLRNDLILNEVGTGKAIGRAIQRRPGV